MVTLTATASPGFRFAGWVVDGNAEDIDLSRTIVMNNNHTVVATFAPIPATYDLILSATAGGSATAAPSPGPYPTGTPVKLTATANPGYIFTGWTINGADAGSANPRTITMDGNKTVVANFAVLAPTYTLTLSAGSGGSASGGGTYTAGSQATLTATPDAGSVFTGWTVDGQFAGWASPLTLTVSGNHSVVATFAARPSFPDVPPSHPAYEAISQLAAQGVIRGYQDGRYGPNDTTLRAQMAALIARAMGWDAEDHGNRFPDRGSVDANLWRNVGTLAYYDVARGFPNGTYKPTNPVLYAQTISFITRAMVAKGYWIQQPDDPALYPNVPASSGHRQDLATYHYYAGVVPGSTPTASWGVWDQPSTRDWFAQTLWQALDSNFGKDRMP